ncbi:sulfotransferase domain-containing protein [Roseibacillus persicicus]|uniref:sulfotransferase domain-containing protein n=1 Tax=Roseibacillus persicicus TaxID=454148 RepID=UPI00398A66E7
MARQSSNGVLLVSLPKSGTHLLERAICLWPQYYRPIKPTIRKRNLEKYGGVEKIIAGIKPSQVIVSHLKFDEVVAKSIEKESLRTIFICRDLRDVVVSFAHHVTSLKTHSQRDFFVGKSLKEKILHSMTGEENRKSIFELFRSYQGWLDSSAFVIRFEDLVGSSGGGNQDNQRVVLEKLWNHLGLPREEDKRGKIADAIFSKASPTYRSGKLGGWQDVFDDEIRETFERHGEGLLERFGYKW